MKKIKYCALTTISSSMKSFMLPALYELKENGFEITVACAADDELAEQIKNDMRYFPLDISRGFNLKKTISNIFRLARFFRKEKFDVIEYGTENVSLCASVAGFLAGTPIRIYDHWGARYVGLTGISRFLSVWIERIAALFSTDIRQVSNLNSEMCVKQRIYPKRKVKVLGKGGTIGVDFNKFDCSKKEEYRKSVTESYSLSDNAIIFGYVGRIQRDKGINELLSAFKEIYRKDNNAFLILVGPIDTENPILEDNYNWAKACPNVIFTGYVSDIYRWMGAFDILVHPTYREGFGMVLQEAAAMKTPIITTDIMGPGEFINDEKTGILVNAKDSEDLKNAMIKMKEHKELRLEFAEKCYDYTKENFERSVMVKRILDDRKNLAEKKGII